MTQPNQPNNIARQLKAIASQIRTAQQQIQMPGNGPFSDKEIADIRENAEIVSRSVKALSAIYDSFKSTSDTPASMGFVNVNFDEKIGTSRQKSETVQNNVTDLALDFLILETINYIQAHGQLATINKLFQVLSAYRADFNRASVRTKLTNWKKEGLLDWPPRNLKMIKILEKGLQKRDALFPYAEERKSKVEIALQSFDGRFQLNSTLTVDAGPQPELRPRTG